MDIRTVVEDYIIVVWIFLALLVALLIREYADRSQFEWHVYPTLFMAYFASFGIMFLCAPDLALTLEARHHADEVSVEQYDGLSNELSNFYASLYWPCFVLNGALQLQEMYMTSGYFSPLGRIMDTFRRGVKMFVAVLVLALISLAVMLASNKFVGAEALQVWLIAFANVYGLFVMVILLGYGVVEFPKSLWRASDVHDLLKQTQAKASSALTQLEAATVAMSTTLQDVAKTQLHVDREGDVDLQDLMEEIVGRCPGDLTRRKGTTGTIAMNASNEVTKASLAALHRRLILNIAQQRACQGRFERIKQSVWVLQDICQSLRREDGVRRVKWSFGRPEGSTREFAWYYHYRKPFYRFASIVAAALSGTVLFAELGAAAGPKSHLSLWGEVLASDSLHAFAVMLLVFVSLGYMVFVCVWSMFEIRISGLLALVPKQQSSPKTMSFVGRRLVGMAAPLVYNFLTMVFETDNMYQSSTYVTGFTRMYGDMDTSAVWAHFNTGFPIVTVVVALAQHFNLFNRIFVALDMSEYQFGEEVVDEKTLTKAINRLERERNQLQRSVERNLQTQAVQLLLSGGGGGGSSEGASLQKTQDPMAKAPGGSGGSGGGVAGKRGRRRSSLFAPDAYGDIAHLKREPALHAGFLDKKSPNSHQWLRRYFVVHAPGVLSYYKEEVKDPCNRPANPSGSIDLRLSLGVRYHSRKHTGELDPRRIDVVTPDRRYKLRAPSTKEGEAWLTAITEWRDHAIDQNAYGTVAHYGEEDTDGISLNSIYSASGNNGNSNNGGKQSGSASSVTSPTRDADRGDSSTNIMSPLHKQQRQHHADTDSLIPPTSDNSTRFGNGSEGDPEQPSPPEDRGTQLRLSRRSSTAPPPILKGMLKKKARNKKQWYNSNWQDRYFCVQPADGTLKYFKSDADAEAKGSIDLKMMLDVRKHLGSKDAQVKDPTRFDIELSTFVLRMKADTADEADRWVAGLLEWRDFLYANFDLTAMEISEGFSKANANGGASV